MAAKIVLERLEFHGRIGITPEERRRLQPLAIDLELDCATEPAVASDNLDDTIDYAQVAARIVEVGAKQECRLLETLAERIAAILFAEFPIERARLWVRKLAPPLTHIAGSVGVRLDRTRLAQQIHQPDPIPARFLIEQFHRLPKGKALDVAAGSGRNALYLAAHGFEVEAIDRDEEALAMLAATANQRHLSVTVRTVDLEQPAPQAPELPKNRYDVILVFFYLYRSLFPLLIDALKPNGVLVYETFTIDNYFRHRHPRRWEFCLAQNELLRLTSQLRVLHYDEGEHDGGHGGGPAFTARLVAQKAGARPSHEPS